MPGRSSYLFANGLRIHYYAWGEPQNDRTLVLVHGLASNARIWELTAPYLAEQGYHVLALDVRGHGLSDKPENDYGFAAVRADLLACLNAWQLNRPVVAGHSWGASLALDLAAHQWAGPLAPAGIALVDGGLIQINRIPGATWESTRQRLTPPRLAGTPLAEFMKRLEGSRAGWQPDAAAQAIILANFAVDEDERIAPHLTFEHHMQIVRAMWEFETHEVMRQVRCPVLALPARPPASEMQYGKEYLEQKALGLEWAKAVLPEMEVSWMLDSIHDVPLQRPQELAERLGDFARRCWASPAPSADVRRVRR